MEIVLEIVLTGLLAATLVCAVRLERALRVLKRDRSAFEALVAGFKASTRQAEAGIERLRGAADGTGRQITHQLDEGRALKDDMSFLLERGTRLADQLEALVRVGRRPAAEPSRAGVGPGNSPRDSSPESFRGRAGVEPGLNSAVDAVVGAVMNGAASQAAAAPMTIAPGKAALPDQVVPRGGATRGKAPMAGATAPRGKAAARGKAVPISPAAPRSQAERDLLKALRLMR
jgi:hypothetical protein